MQSHVIVGAGQAGAHAAIAMRNAGYGGHIVLVGDEPAAPYDRPPLSKSFITAAEMESLNYFFSPAAFALARIELLTGLAAEGIDRAEARVRLARGGSVPFDKLILATGSAARMPAVPGSEHILVLRTFLDAVRIKAALTPGCSVVCIGAGVIGLELASSARARGCHVTVVEKEEAVMCRSLDRELAGAVTDLHRSAGVEFVFGTEVAAVEPGSVLLRNGASLAADVVAAGIGVERNVSLPKAAGIEVGRGILTDPAGRTNVEGIFAAGEVAEFFSRRAGEHVVLESWRHAQDHGSLVGRSAAGLEETYDEVPWFWTDQHGVNIQVAGNARRAARTVYRGNREGGAFCAFRLDERSSVIGAVGFNAGRDVSAAMRLIRDGKAADAADLADPAFNLRKLLVSTAAKVAVS